MRISLRDKIQQTFIQIHMRLINLLGLNIFFIKLTVFNENIPYLMKLCVSFRRYVQIFIFTQINILHLYILLKIQLLYGMV